jgi:hypothetical protein
MVSTDFRLCSCDGYRDQGDDSERRQPEVDVYVGEQAALGDYVVLEELQCAERGDAGGAAVAVNQIGILRQRRARGGVETIGHVQEPRRMQRHAPIENDRRRSNPKSVAQLAHEVVAGGNIVEIDGRLR